MFKRIFCFLLFAGAVLNCYAEREIAVVKAGSAYVKLKVDIAGLECRGKTASEFRAILENDLKLSGWFTFDAAGQASITVAGTCSASGDRLTVSCDVSNVVSGKRYLSRNGAGSSADIRTMAHSLADEIVYNVKNVRGMASTRIAMIGSRSGKKDVYVCDYDGANLMRWTRDNAVCISPNWTPKADKLVYTSYLKGFPDVYCIDMKSGVRSKVSNFPGLNAGADVSPDGRLLALTLSRDGNPELYTVNIRSGRPKRLTRSGNAAEASPSWSPDGQRIVFVKDSTGSPQLYIMDSRTGSERRITFEGSENVAPDWGPDGKIVYSSRRGGRYELCVIENPANGKSVQLTSDGADYEDPSWAPDGRHIVCSRTVGYKPDLYILDTLGDAPIRLTKQQGDWYSPAWSPE